MSNPPASGSEDNADPASTDKTDTKPKGEGGKRKAMEKAQKEAAEERANEGGYQ